MANIDIGGRLHSTATGNVVAGANEILDDSKGKKQSVINQETGEALSSLNTEVAGKQDTINDLSTIRSGAAAGATAYQKPSGGIPKSDTDSGVQQSLDLADTAIQADPIGTIVPPVDPSEFATQEEVSQLSADLTDLAYPNEYTILDKDELLSGKFISSNGTATDFANYDIYVYSLANINRVRIKASTAVDSLLLYAFYSTDTIAAANVVELGENPTDGSYDKIVSVPAGANYLAVTIWKTGGQVTEISKVTRGNLLEDVKEIQQDVSEIDDVLEDSVEKINTYHPFFPISATMTADRTDEGKFLKQNGDEDAHANYSVLVYDLTGISKVNIYGKNANSVVRVYNFYNSDTLSSATLVSAGPEMTQNYDYDVDVPEGATFLACTKFNNQTLSVSMLSSEQVANEVRVENGNKVTFCTPSGGKKLYMVIGPTDPGMGNGLIDFRYWGYVPMNGNLSSTPTELYHSSSDCFGPFRIKALSNIDGDDVDSNNFTGGSHQYNNGITGSTPTARLGNVEIRVDGVRVESFQGAFREFEMIWEAFVQANNTRKSDGTGREVLKEIITLKYIGGEFLCRTELVPLEDISIYRWYGYQTCGYNPGNPPSIGDYWYYVNATNRELNNAKSGNKDAVGMVAWTDDFHQEMWIDPSIDLGKRFFVTDNIDNGIFRDGSKAYFMIVDFANTIQANNRYILDGKFIFKLK